MIDFDKLGFRQRQVADMVAQGMRTKEIARKLDMAESTVDGHICQIKAKLGFESTTAMRRLLGADRVVGAVFNANEGTEHRPIWLPVPAEGLKNFTVYDIVRRTV